MEATGEVASQLEVKLSVLIEHLRTSDGDSFDIQSLNKQIRNLMEQLRAKIKNLESQQREARVSNEREELKGLADWHNSQLIDLQTKLKRANLSVKAKLVKKDRESLLGLSTDEETSQTRQRKRQDGSLQAASNVTDSLKELRQTLASSVSRSEDTMRTLVDSSSVLKDTSSEMEAMGSHIDISHRLITKFGRRDVVDKILIFFGLVLFFSVVVYILKKRIFG